MKFNQHSVFVGVDVHKYSHTAVAMDCHGQEIDSYVFNNKKINQFLKWLGSIGKKENIIVGIEDVYNTGIHLASKLEEAKIKTQYVPPVLTYEERRHSIKREKSDLKDAKRVGKVILYKIEETLPVMSIIQKGQGEIKSLDLIVKERERLIKQQTGLKNQLHSMLHAYYGDDYRKGESNCFSQRGIERYKRELRKDKGKNVWQESIKGGILRRLEQLEVVKKQIKELEGEIKEISRKVKGVKELQEKIKGCGLISASKIITEIKSIKRFKKKSKLASYAGIAPVMEGSGKRVRWKTNKGGNRRLNRAIHQIALSQIGNRGTEESKRYYGKKQREGKSKLWSIRCLKRQIINQVYKILKEIE